MSTDTLLDRRPRLLPGVEFSAARLRGPTAVFSLKHPVNGQSYEVGPKEKFIISRLDGRTLATINSEYAATYGRQLGPANWLHILETLHRRDLVAGAPALSRAAATVPRRNTLWHGVRTIRGDVGARVDHWYRSVRLLLQPVVVVPTVLAMVLMLGYILAHAATLLDGTLALVTQPVWLVTVIVLLWLSFGAHEIGHGVVARHFGGRVTEVGLMWRFPGVMLFCRVENYLYLRSRRAQVVTAGAGAYVNFLLLLPVAAFWVWGQPTGGLADATAGLLLLGSVVPALQLLPLPPLDGYQLVGHALGVSGLAEESRRFVTLLARRILRRQDGNPIAVYPVRARVIYTGYALAAGLLILTISVGMVVVAYRSLTHTYGVGAGIGGATAVVFVIVGAAASGNLKRRIARTAQQ